MTKSMALLVKETRKLNLLTQNQLSEISGITPVTINRIEKGHPSRLSVIDKLFTSMNKKVIYDVIDLESPVTD